MHCGSSCVADIRYASQPSLHPYKTETKDTESRERVLLVCASVAASWKSKAAQNYFETLHLIARFRGSHSVKLHGVTT